jgi:LPS export ABC transporter permease LptG
MPSLLDRYVVRELVSPFLAGTFAFLVVLIGDILYVLAEYLARGQVPLWALLRLFFYKLPHMLVLTFPVSALLATLLGVGRLAKDGEVTALRMAGLSLTRVFVPVAGFGLAVSTLSFSVNEYLTPAANRKADQLVRNAIFRDAFPNVREDVFFRAPDSRYFYVRRVDYNTRTLQGVMVYETGRPFPRLITAQRASLQEGKLHLEDGVVRELDAQGFTTYEAGFRELDLQMGAEQQGLLLQQKTPNEMSAAELRRHLDQLRQSGVDPNPVAVDYYFKFAAPAAALIFAFMSAPLGLAFARGGRYTGVGVAIALVFVYYAVMNTARAWAKAGAFPPFLGAWAANLVFLAVGVVLYAYVEGLVVFRRPPAGPPVAARPVETS